MSKGHFEDPPDSGGSSPEFISGEKDPHGHDLCLLEKRPYTLVTVPSNRALAQKEKPMHSLETFSSPLEVCPFFSRMSLLTAVFAVTLAISLASSKNFYLQEVGLKQPIDKSATGKCRLKAERPTNSDWDQ